MNKTWFRVERKVACAELVAGAQCGSHDQLNATAPYGQSNGYRSDQSCCCVNACVFDGARIRTCQWVVRWQMGIGVKVCLKRNRQAS